MFASWLWPTGKIWRTCSLLFETSTSNSVFIAQETKQSQLLIVTMGSNWKFALLHPVIFIKFLLAAKKKKLNADNFQDLENKSKQKRKEKKQLIDLKGIASIESSLEHIRRDTNYQTYGTYEKWSHSGDKRFVPNAWITNKGEFKKPSNIFLKLCCA